MPEWLMRLIFGGRRRKKRIARWKEKLRLWNIHLQIEEVKLLEKQNWEKAKTEGALFSEFELDFCREITDGWDKTSLEEMHRVEQMVRRAKIPYDSYCLLCSETHFERLVHHHQDYSKPFDVVTLCYKHHRLVHSNILREHYILEIERKLGHIPPKVIPLLDLSNY